MNSSNLCFEQKYEKYSFFYLKIFNFLEVKFSIYLNRRVFVMTRIDSKWYKFIYPVKSCYADILLNNNLK